MVLFSIRSPFTEVVFVCVPPAQSESEVQIMEGARARIAKKARAAKADKERTEA